MIEKWAFNRAGHCCRKLKISGASNTDDFYQEVIGKVGCYLSEFLNKLPSVFQTSNTNIKKIKQTHQNSARIPVEKAAGYV